MGFRFELRADRANERTNFRNIFATSDIACWGHRDATEAHHAADAPRGISE
jgi:hypothetical protein